MISSPSVFRSSILTKSDRTTADNIKIWKYEEGLMFRMDTFPVEVVTFKIKVDKLKVLISSCTSFNVFISSLKVASMLDRWVCHVTLTSSVWLGCFQSSCVLMNKSWLIMCLVINLLRGTFSLTSTYFYNKLQSCLPCYLKIHSLFSLVNILRHFVLSEQQRFSFNKTKKNLTAEEKS